MVGEFCWNW